jgi:hypothetical protein
LEGLRRELEELCRVREAAASEAAPRAALVARELSLVPVRLAAAGRAPEPAHRVVPARTRTRARRAGEVRRDREREVQREQGELPEVLGPLARRAGRRAWAECSRVEASA